MSASNSTTQSNPGVQDSDKKVDAYCSKLIENYRVLLKTSQIDINRVSELPMQNFEEFQAMIAVDSIVSV